MNISVDGNKRCPVISIDGEIMGTPSGVPDFLHISENNSLNLPAEIRNNSLFAKNLSLILHLHRQRLSKKISDSIGFDEAKAFRKATGSYLRENQWNDLTVDVYLEY